MFYTHIYFANQVSFGHLISSDYTRSFQLLAIVREHDVKLVITLSAFDFHDNVHDIGFMICEHYLVSLYLMDLLTFCFIKYIV
jgi:hypothetical protein